MADFCMMFNRRVDISICSAPRDFQLLLLSPTYANEHVLQVTLYTIPFNRPLSGRSLGFLKIFPNVRTGLNAVLMFSRLKIVSECVK